MQCIPLHNRVVYVHQCHPKATLVSGVEWGSVPPQGQDSDLWAFGWSFSGHWESAPELHKSNLIFDQSKDKDRNLDPDSKIHN